MKENQFQSKCVKRLKREFPDAIVFKNEAKQGYPDLLVLNDDRWAALECKRSLDAAHQPLQDYYVREMNSMSYAAFLAPENEEAVFDDLREHFR